MRSSFWILTILLLVAAEASSARADSIGLYTVTFTCTSTCSILPTAPPVSLTSPDLQVTWNGYLFDFSSQGSTFFRPFNPAGPFNWELLPETSQINGVTSYYVAFQVLAGPIPPFGSGYGEIIPVTQDAFNEATGSGNLLFTPAVTPEPSSLVLVFSGIGLLFVWRKRLSPRNA